MLEKDRINELIEAVMKVAMGDYSAQIELSGKNDELDSLAMGLNMMIDNIRNEITKRKRAENVLERSEEKYRELINTSIDGVMSIDQQMRIILWNSGAEKIFGFTEEEILEESVMKIVPEKHRVAMKKGFAEFRKDGLGPFIGKLVQIEGLKKDGTEIPVELAVSSRKAGDSYIATAIIRDITERKRAEEVLQKKTYDLGERLKELSCLYGIDEICRRDGVAIDEVLKEAVRLMPPSWQYPEVTGGHIRYKKKEYQTENFKVTQWKQRTDLIVNNKKCGLVEVCYLEEKPESDEGPFLKEERDLINAVAERLSQFIGGRQAAVDLKDSEEQYKDLVEKAGIAILVDDENGNITYANKKAEELYGYPLEEMKNQSIQSLVHPDDVKKVAKFHNDRLQGKKVPARYEFKGIKKDGSIIHVELDVVELKEKGRATGTRMYLKNISERKKAEEKIEKSLKEKEVLLKEIHHRVKNNMQIISSLLNIQSANIEDENVREMFNVSQGRIRSMALMHETLYKSEDLARIDFSEYIRRLTTHLMSVYRVGMEPIRLNLDIVDVYLDINRAIPCGMIISELVSNSLKHAFPDGKGGEIAVKMFTDKKKKVTLIVSDTGVGFPEGLDFRETKSMGMQLVTDLTRQIKGTIKIGRDKGTEFKIVF